MATEHESALLNAVNRCVEAYNQVHADLPQRAGSGDRYDNEQEARKAYTARLPLLHDPASFQAYIACIAHGVSIEVIDIVDAGRYCHLAQMAISAWKLLHPAAPAAQSKQRPNPLPPAKGNHFESSGAPGLDSETREGCQTTSQPSGDPEIPSETPETATPLPPNGNHPEVLEPLATIPQPSVIDQQDQPLTVTYVPGSGTRGLQKACHKLLEGAAADPVLVKQLSPELRRNLEQFIPEPVKPSPEAAHEAQNDPVLTA